MVCANPASEAQFCDPLAGTRLFEVAEATACARGGCLGSSRDGDVTDGSRRDALAENVG